VAVIGSGPNGLAAAVVLTEAGLAVRVHEGAATPGGGCRTEELTLPGLRHDVCSAVHPLAAASPFFRRFDLASRGVNLLVPPVAYAHPLDGGRAAAVWGSVADTAGGLGRDGPAYRSTFGPLVGNGLDLVDQVLAPMRGPGRHPLALAGFGLQAMRSAVAVAGRFATDEARALFAGVAAHAVAPLDAPMTAGVGLLLGMLAHLVGWPVVEGGSARLVDAMIDVIETGGGEIVTGQWVRALDDVAPARLVLADVSPGALADLAGSRLAAGYAQAMRRFKHGPGVCKVDWAISEPVPWAAEVCRRAGTVHLGGTFEEIARAEAEVAGGRHPDAPYVLVVQAGVADPSRAASLWSYCHVPAGSTLDMTPAIAAQLERFAPGFGDIVVARASRTAAAVEADNPNYVGGDIGGGSQSLQRTLLGPAPHWNPYRTPLPGLYLCSSSTPPGPGVHGRCGELAALAALSELRRSGR
jgi:phytoene dehydrogenase-like protein